MCPEFGEAISHIHLDLYRSVQSQLYKVLQLRSTSWAFAALRSDGLVVTWGDPEHGGDSSQVPWSSVVILSEYWDFTKFD